MLDIYKKSLKIIEEIYHLSQYYKDEDLFRIVDIIHSLDDKQIICKNDLCENLHNLHNNNKFSVDWDDRIPLEKEKYNILIGGGWYGLNANLLKDKFKNCKIDSLDMDSGCYVWGKKLFPEVNFIIEDLFEYETDVTYDIFISTSVEHFDKEEFVYYLKEKKFKICALQSNNFYEIDTHINCSKDIDEFIEYLPLTKILYKNTIKFDEYDRFTVIGQ